jgi:hypothetical protein
MAIKKLTIILLTVVFLTGISWLINSRSLLGIDDANIYFIYMRNLANGHGFVYNVGGERVEGFTSLLWTLIGSVFYLFTPNPEKLLIGLNILLLTLSLYLITEWIDKGKKNNRLFTIRSLLFLGLIAVTPGFVDWTVLSLLETGLWSFLLILTGITILSEEENFSSGSRYLLLALLFSLLLLCRPEAMLWVPVFIAMEAFKNWSKGKSIGQIIKLAVPLVLVFFGVLSALTFWRLKYFGYPLPNTYYAKVSNNRIDNIIAGLSYLEKAFLSKPFILLILIFSLYKLYCNWIKKEKPGTTFILLNAIVLVTLMVPLYSGGDHFGHQRFIMPTLPFIIATLIFSMEDKSLWSKPVVFLILSFVFLSSAYSVKDLMLARKEGTSRLDWSYETGWNVRWNKQVESPVKAEWDITDRCREEAATLNQFFEGTALPSQGVFMAGAMAYVYKGETVDLLGLNNVSMAHAKKEKEKWALKNHASFDKSTFFVLAPDIFWFGPSTFIDTAYGSKEAVKMDSTSFGIGFCQNIQNESKFKEMYGFYRISKLNSAKDLQIFSKRSFIGKLDPAIYKTRELRVD